ncbi:IQ domain-containing protein N-like [Alligator mississippiensis]|uniref:IQ domain-containing protein N-like n=1 Tax=Alligator mississippiensis TaxID=8496 RepID=UPI002877A101|nr:IQ domain-containing protein N-like [Alligator mississippiensis]
MEAAREGRSSSPSCSGRPRRQLSLVDPQPGAAQDGPRPRIRISPGRLRTHRRASSFEDVLVDELEMLLNNAATTIQAAWRGHRARQQLCDQYHAAVTIQVAWKDFLTRQGLVPGGYGAGQEPRDAAPLHGYRIRHELSWSRLRPEEDAAWRGYRAGQEVTWTRPEPEPAAPWQGSQARKQPVSAKPRRGSPSRQEPARWRESQAQAGRQWPGPKAEPAAPWRGHWARPRPAEKEAAAAAIQAGWRGHQARSKIRTRHQAATIIQAHWWGYLTRLALAEKRCAARTIQAHWRSYQARRALVRWHRAATILQAHWRGYRARQGRWGPAPLRGQPRAPSYPGGYASHVQRGRLSYVMGASEMPPPARPVPGGHSCPRAQSRMDAWPSRPCKGCKERPLRQPGLVQRVDTEPSVCKRCPWCGRRTTTRVLLGTGKGPARVSGSSSESSDTGEQWPQTAASLRGSRRTPGTGYLAGSCRAWQAGRSACQRTQLASASASSQGSYWSAGAPPDGRAVPGGRADAYQQGRTHYRPGPQAAAWYGGPSTAPCHSSPRSAGPACGSSSWRAGQGERRVFKSRKQYQDLMRAATCIQAFWRGWQARRALCQHHPAALHIQSTFRSRCTRVCLEEAGRPDRDETDEEPDDRWGTPRYR